VQLINADGSISVRTLAERDLMWRGGCPMVGLRDRIRYTNRLACEDSVLVKTWLGTETAGAAGENSY
jgi:hypothetical protein